MIFGRSTVIIMGAVTVTLQFLKQIVPALFPELDRDTVALFFDGMTAVVGAWIAVLANTSTTPVQDPMLKDNTMVKIVDESGVIIDHKPILADKPEA